MGHVTKVLLFQSFSDWHIEVCFAVQMDCGDSEFTVQLLLIHLSDLIFLLTGCRRV